jgi:TatD DNase family protein
MVETDTPYLSPPPHRGEENEPARVVLVGAALAAAWDEDVAETARLTTAAAEQIFRG